MTITVDASIWRVITESQIAQAQRIGRARAEVRAALEAAEDHASQWFVRQKLQRALEALQ